MFKTVRKSLVIAFCFLVTFHLSAQTGKIMFYLNPSNSPGDLMKSGEQMKKLIEKETGLDLDMEVPASHEALVAKFGENKPCFGLLNSQSYVIANTKFGAKAKLRILRYGTGLYYGMIVAKASSGIKTIDDLNGKTIAYTDKLSTSGYLYPKKLLAKKGVKPGKTLFLNTHEEVISQVYEGKVDAGAAFYSPATGDELRDARARVIKKYPDVGKEVIVLAKTDPIPNDPITFSKSISSELALKIAVAMVKIAATDEGKKLLKDMYGIEGLARASDGDYNSLRAVISAN
jgi:phosphonate transport system substrate-binding protein